MAGQAGAGTVPGAVRKGFKAELDSLRERIGGRGFSHDEIAAEIGRRYRVRPREGYRLAWGWSLEKAAGRFNDYAAGQDGTDAGAGLTGSRLSEYEHWPQTARKPSVHALARLARIGPAIAAMSGGGYETAFQASTSDFTLWGTAGNVTTNQQMPSGTSPSVAG
jgi:hypothetical protein